MEVTSELHQAVGRIEGKVDILLSISGTHDHRLSVVEKRQWIGIGGLAIGGALLMPRLKEVFDPIVAALAH